MRRFAPVAFLALLLAGCAAPADPLAPAALPRGSEPPEAAAPAASGAPSGPALAGELRVTGELAVRETRIGVAAADAPPLGVEGAAVALASPAARARTRLVADHWTLEIDLAAASDDLAGGEFRAVLAWDGELKGDVRLAGPAAPVAGARAAATVTFDLGAEIASSAAYVLLVERVPDAAQPIDVAVESIAGASLVWRGRDALAGRENPAIDAPAGTPVRFAARNSDGGFHNLLVRDDTGAVVAGPTPDFTELGVEETLLWAGAMSGRFEYACRYHPTMRGEIRVV